MGNGRPVYHDHSVGNPPAGTEAVNGMKYPKRGKDLEIPTRAGDYWRQIKRVKFMRRPNLNILAALLTSILLVGCTGAFPALEPSTQSPPPAEVPQVVNASYQPEPAAETLFLGDGFANAEGPASITLGSSASVVLTIALEKPVRVENVTWTATPEGRHVVKARPVSATSNLQDAELNQS